MNKFIIILFCLVNLGVVFCSQVVSRLDDPKFKPIWYDENREENIRLADAPYQRHLASPNAIIWATPEESLAQMKRMVFVFKNKRNEIIYELNYMLPLGNYLISTVLFLPIVFIRVEPSFIYNFSFLLSSMMAFDISGPYKYQNYPFEYENSFLSREKGKDWAMRGKVDYNIKNKSYGFSGDIYYYLIGFNADLFLNENNKFDYYLANAIWHYARNDFFDLQLGLGYGYFDAKYKGINTHYSFEFFLEPLHWFYEYNNVSKGFFIEEIAQRSRIGLGYLIDRYEILVTYQSLTKTYQNEWEESYTIGCSVWF